MTNIENFINLIKENPSLPIVPMVDCDVVADDSFCRWMGSFGKSYIGEYAIYDNEYFDDRYDFKDYYYDNNYDELYEKFGYDPAISEYTTKIGKHTQEQFNENKENEKFLDKYLDKITDKYFVKAIIVNIDSF